MVGVDGSEGAGAALAFAVAEAALRRAQLHVVCAWDLPVEAFGGGFGPPLEASTFDAFRERAESIAGDAAAAAKRLEPDVTCDGVAVKGQAAAVLLRESRGRKPDRGR